MSLEKGVPAQTPQLKLPGTPHLPAPQEVHEQGLARVAQEILTLCEQNQDVQIDWVVQQLVQDRIVPPGVMQLVEKNILPLLADIQEELRVGSRVGLELPNVKTQLVERARQKLFSFFEQERRMLGVFQSAAQLDSSTVISVAATALEHGQSYDGIDNTTLIASNERLADLWRAEHNRIKAIIADRVTKYLQDQLQQLTHRERIEITVTSRAVDDQNDVLLLEFDVSPDTDQERGIVRDMRAIEQAVHQMFPGLNVYGVNSEASAKYGNKALTLSLSPRR